MDQITVGCITLTKVEYNRDDDPIVDEVDGYPEFTVAGTVEIAGVKHEFERTVGLELDGRDAAEKHISGFDWDESDDENVDLSQISEDLYNAIYASEPYQQAARAFHGIES